MKKHSIMRLMKKGLLTTAATLFLIAPSAHAADLNTIFDTRSAYDWSGLYMGVHFGLATGTIKDSSSTGSHSASFSDGDSDGGGVLAGWNWQRGNVVYGLEGVLSINEIKSVYSGSAMANHNSDYVWNAELRARAGYSFGRFMPFVSGGIVAGEFYKQSAPTATGPTGEMNSTVGFTAGAGVDVRIADNISVRSEYIYQNFGDKDYHLANVPTTIKSSFDIHMARVALLYHFGNPVTSSDPATSNALLFSGPSLGAHVGLASGDVNLSGYSSGDINLNALTGSVNVGYLYPINNFRVGVEAELALHTGSKAIDPSGPVSNFDYRMMWHAAARAKIGYVYDRFMPYVTAGANLGQFTATSQPSSNTNLDPYKEGFSFGGGIEYAITDRVSADLGYSYNTYDGRPITTNGGTTTVGHDFHHVRLGVVVR